jgi:hypothetical protein
MYIRKLHTNYLSGVFRPKNAMTSIDRLTSQISGDPVHQAVARIIPLQDFLSAGSPYLLHTLNSQPARRLELQPGGCEMF